MVQKLLIVIALVVAAALAVAGCTTPTTNPSSTPSGSISVTAKEARIPQHIGQHTPKEGSKYVAYNVTTTNENAPSRQTQAYFFTLLDSDNRVYNVDYLVLANKSIHAYPEAFTRTQPGDKVNGIIVFEVPQNATLVSLRYDDQLVAGNDYQGPVTVNL